MLLVNDKCICRLWEVVLGILFPDFFQFYQTKFSKNWYKAYHTRFIMYISSIIFPFYFDLLMNII